ncbi:polysaccharide pyruvyl transferase family protein [Arsenicicoccus bolidensis]|uniref:Polysaccharide pyruvyl transferase family protein n=1 Tax=Arsenicicoccus bolidensis TaxID=229480 RepID=A0ABS9Q2C3_9MICO|nr:polysaccharide pyruvyl transferase family protein [Arsenicicoccus bolidensis]MCG7322015.1 polysaccharide pyruvyl transferase family protein [Arsenicicoccus bolidensis]
MKTSVVSFFDSANLGDLLIADSLARFASEFGPAGRISYSGRPFRLINPDQFGGGDQVEPAPPGFRERLVATRAGALAWRVKYTRGTEHAAIRDLLADSDVLVLGGGNMIFDLDHWTHSSDRFSYFSRTAARAGTPTFGISLGIGPFASIRQHKEACRALDRCRWLTFRDRASLDLYEEYGRHAGRLSVDPVLMMPRSLERQMERRGKIAFNLVEPRIIGSTTDEQRNMLLRRYVRDVEEWVASGHTVELFSTDRADLACLHEVAAAVRSGRCGVRMIDGLASLLAMYSEADVVVACRMHALIVAFTQGVPIVGLSWQQKVSSFFDLVGRPRQCLGLRQHAPGRLPRLVSEAMTQPDAFCIDDAVRERLRRLDAVNRQVMREVIEETTLSGPA